MARVRCGLVSPCSRWRSSPCCFPGRSSFSTEVGLVEYIRPGLEFSRAEADATVLRALPRPRPRRADPDAREPGGLALLSSLRDAGRMPRVRLVTRATRPGALDRGIGGCRGGVRHGDRHEPRVLSQPACRSPPGRGGPGALLGSWLIGLAWRTQGMTMRGVGLAVATAVFVISASAVLVIADVAGELNRAGVLGRRGAMQERIADLILGCRKPCRSAVIFQAATPKRSCRSTPTSRGARRRAIES